MATGSISLTHIFPGIDTAPLFYISTHGFYDLEIYKEKKIPIEISVPLNTLVIETASIQSYCYFKNVLLAMAPLFNDRAMFLNYLSGNIPEGVTDGEKNVIITCLKTCYMYFPGQPIANRILEMTGGLDRARDKVESERTSDYKEMGFFRYDVNGGAAGGSVKTDILKDVRGRLIEEAYGCVTGVGCDVKDGSFETYATMFDRIDKQPSDLHGFKIIFFSSCGEVRQSTPPDLINPSRIERIQTLALNKWKNDIGADFKALHRVYRTAKITRETAAVFGLTGKGARGTVPRRHVNFEGHQTDPKVTNYSLRSKNKAGGTRRFVKKSKGKRKTRKIL
jgi:hypothetical protein